jgi:hypothetical protein
MDKTFIQPNYIEVSTNLALDGSTVSNTKYVTLVSGDVRSNVSWDGSTVSDSYNLRKCITSMKGTLVNLADTFILYNVVKVGYQVLSDSNRVIIWLYTSYTDSSHYEAFRIDFNGSNHRIFFQKLVNGAETTIGYVTLS